MIISLLGLHIDKRLYFIPFHFAVEPHQSAVIAVGTDDDELSDYVALAFIIIFTVSPSSQLVTSGS